MIKTYKIILKGKVQGVGLRKYLHKIATKQNICGYVENLDNGTVLMIAKSDEENLHTLIKLASKGSILAKVVCITVSEVNEEIKCNEFIIKY